MGVNEAIEAAHAVLTRAALDAPDAIALVDRSSSWTYAAFEAESATRARSLAAGAAAATRPIVAAALPCEIGSIRLLHACLAAGVPLAALHPRWTEREREACVAQLQPAELLDPDAALARDLPLALDPESPALVVYTSGSSGAPRPLVLSRRAFVAAAIVSRAAIPLGPGDRWLLSMPLGHVGGLSIVGRCLVARATIVLDPRPFLADTWVERVAEASVSHASIVPTMLRRLVDRGAPCPPTLRVLVVGGAACDPRLADDALALGYPVRRTYGMTETCAMATCEAAPREGGVGRPLEGMRLRVVEGEVRVKGPTLATGTWGAGITPLPLDEDGWLRSADRGAIDASGVVTIHGRVDDVIVTGGENVHPAEVEAAILAVPRVEAAAVFGLPDAEWGERVVAVYAAPPELDEAALEAELRATLAGFRRPRALLRVDVAPSLPSGKVDRVALRALARARLAQ